MAIGGLENRGNERIINVGFEQGVKTNLLQFAQAGEDGYFYLKYDPPTAGTPTIGYEKGTITYGGEIYKIKYAERLYLLIRMDQQYREALDYQEIKGWPFGS